MGGQLGVDRYPGLDIRKYIRICDDRQTSWNETIEENIDKKGKIYAFALKVYKEELIKREFLVEVTNPRGGVGLVRIIILLGGRRTTSK